MSIRIIESVAPFDEIRSLLREEAVDDPGFQGQVREIIRSVIERGDAALLELTARYDDYRVASAAELKLGADQLAEAARGLDPALLASLKFAADNIADFHRKQLDPGYLDHYPDGTVLGQRVQALARVGVYVPGGQASYPSSVLMNVIPARVAGVDSIAMCVPAPGGKLEPAVLAAAHLAGVDEVFTIGGAQAVAALAYGTESVAPVDKIVGPGNKWVAEAKRQVFGRVDIDMVAGPSEILVVADGGANPRQIAADLIGQAEHDRDAIAWLVTTEPSLVAPVEQELDKLLAENPRRAIARQSLERNGLIVIVGNLEDAAVVANLRAPEHLELIVEDPMALAGQIRNAGAIFLGAYTPEPLGDYLAGPNHVLPTGGTARWASPLGTYEFLKRTSLIGYSRERLVAHAADTIRLAESEGLHGHAAAIRVRLE